MQSEPFSDVVRDALRARDKNVSWLHDRLLKDGRRMSRATLYNRLSGVGSWSFDEIQWVCSAIGIEGSLWTSQNPKVMSLIAKLDRLSEEELSAIELIIDRMSK